MKVELIPVLEIGIKELENKYQQLIDGYYIYRLNQFNSLQDLLKIVRSHLNMDQTDVDPVPLRESWALYGGYVLRLDGEVVFVPQCCSTLADFESWKSIVDDDFKRGYICPEGHPNPKITRRKDVLTLDCINDCFDTFLEPSVYNKKIDRLQMKKAIQSCENELNEFANRLNLLDKEFGEVEIAKVLIHELT
jgi:hypothetical protein